MKARAEEKEVAPSGCVSSGGEGTPRGGFEVPCVFPVNPFIRGTMTGRPSANSFLAGGQTISAARSDVSTILLFSAASCCIVYKVEYFNGGNR